MPIRGWDALYSQIYLHDPALAALARSRRASELDVAIVYSLTLTLQECNPMIRMYLTAREQLAEIALAVEYFRLILNQRLQLVVEHGTDLRRQHLPTADQVSMILPEEYGGAGFRDPVLARRIDDNYYANPFTYINSNHASYLPLHYNLLFPYGEPGWHWGRTLEICEGNLQNKNVSPRTFYRFRLHTRPHEASTLFLAQSLFQQFVVDT